MLIFDISAHFSRPFRSITRSKYTYILYICARESSNQSR